MATTARVGPGSAGTYIKIFDEIFQNFEKFSGRFARPENFEKFSGRFTRSEILGWGFPRPMGF